VHEGIPVGELSREIISLAGQGVSFLIFLTVLVFLPFALSRCCSTIGSVRRPGTVTGRDGLQPGTSPTGSSSLK